MQFSFRLGTKIYFGRNCLMENKSELYHIGKKCMIVTGKASGRKSGALTQLISILSELSIDYIVHEGIDNNPTLENVEAAGKIARENKVDFIAGIGGGSPLDASKAVAVLAVNDIEPVELYKNKYQNDPLPNIAIPTTAGTGSEVTPYSILTRKDMHNKMSFSNDKLFPVIAFLDPTFTESLSYRVTLDTAVDALSHSVEGYTSKRSTMMTDLLAEKAIATFGECIRGLLDNKIDYDIREKLLYMSMLSGIVISQTGTSIVHGLGYPLTYYKDIPHGRANGMLLEQYLRFNYEEIKGKIDNVIRLLKLESIDEFGIVMGKLVMEDVNLSKDEIELFAGTGFKHRSREYNARSITLEDMKSMLSEIFRGGN